MKYILLSLFLCLSISCFAQPDNIKRILEKASSGKELTEAEQGALDRWADSMQKQYGDSEKTIAEIPESKTGSEM